LSDTWRPQQVIGGETHAAASGGTIPVVNPATADVIGSIPRGGADDVDLAVRAARRSTETWRWVPPSERYKILTSVANGIRKHADELTEAEYVDTGKPRSQARGEVETAAKYFEYAAGAVDKITGTTLPVGRGAVDFTLREPWGVSAQIVPWNYPLVLATRGIAPALAMGNTVVLKPAEDASLSCLLFARVALDSGLPPGVLNVVTGYGHEAGADLASHPDIDHLTFTGSVATGTRVMQLAAQNIVPVTLELGGKSPHIVFDDADLERAIPVILRSFVSNAGQTCSAGTRVLVQDTIHDEVLKRLKAAAESVRIGLPEDDPDLGPLISERQLARVAGFVDEGASHGHAVVTGGGRPSPATGLKGFYFLPTVFDDIPPTSRLFYEEIFGPVLCVTRFSDVAEAISLANATPYGLNTGIWTRNVSRALEVATQVKAGMVYVNSFGLKENVGIPFGGYKKSGFGREKGLEAFLGYSQVKNVAVVYE
jgi:aldehyde dehydrogenase (NAD+)